LEVIKGVQKVETIVTDADDYINREKIKRELQAKIWDIIK